MDFTNNANPAAQIYKEMLLKLYNHYSYHVKPKSYQAFNYMSLLPSESYRAQLDSIDDVLASDSRAVLDKVKNTALGIAYRIKLNQEFNYLLDYQWYTLRKDILWIETSYVARDFGTGRQISTLTSQLFQVYTAKFQEKVECWKDLKEEMKYFINLFHKYKGLSQDKKMLE
jgi:hypothetical protein